MKSKDIIVPDIGDFGKVEIIELLVSVGDTIAAEDSLITVESDKASMEIPSSDSGLVKELKVNLGDFVEEGSVIVVLETTQSAEAPKSTNKPAPVETLQKTPATHRKKQRKRKRERKYNPTNCRYTTVSTRTTAGFHKH